jgi:anti-anti-sigma factor
MTYGPTTPTPFENISGKLSIRALPIRLTDREMEVTVSESEGKEVMLKVKITKLRNLSVLCVEGKIVRGETDALRNAVLAQVDASVVVLDLAGVNTIDAGGLGLMLELRTQTESKGIEFRLENVTKLVRRILEITKLDSVFKISGNDRPDVAIHQRPPVFLQTVSCA